MEKEEEMDVMQGILKAIELPTTIKAGGARVYKKAKNDFNEDVTYIAECTPLVVVEHPDLSSKETYEVDYGDVHYEWKYVVCGVNFPEKMFYVTNTNKLTEEKGFTSDLVLIPSGNTNLTITENSRPGYGFTIIYQLRLWHCLARTLMTSFLVVQVLVAYILLMWLTCWKV